ncbi:MAG: hypothetical protein KC591_01680 [Gemmatimonadetes bacterium]|nr:hypothetical protein [Gemmatimonadota bacterium]
MNSRSVSRRSLGVAVGLAALLPGCTSDSPVPICENCENWTQITTGLGRYPATHPVIEQLIAFSTVDKAVGAPDADRQGDEDLWLTWAEGGSADVNPVWQITGDSVGNGGNFLPRWSPSGMQLAFIHIADDGRFEIWRVAVTPPASPTDTPVIGTPEFLVRNARDPAWLSETQMVFTRDDKLFLLDVPLSGTPATAPLQISFDPPIYATAESFVDRQPDIAPTDSDVGVFNTLGRQNVADVYVEAFEIDDTPETTAVLDAFLYLQQPDASASYPLFEGSDTLRTPSLLQSLPVGDGGDFVVGARLDSRFLADSTRETYCDTTITKIVELLPGDSDTASVYFEVARGTLSITSAVANTSFSWTRQDFRVSSDEFPLATTIQNPGEVVLYNCQLSYAVSGGIPNPNVLEPYLVTGSVDGMADFNTQVFITPGDTTHVVLYGPEPGSTPSPSIPRARVTYVASGASRTRGEPGLPGRAEGDFSTFWRIDFMGTDLPELNEIVGTDRQAQTPAISSEFSGGVRYLAWVEENGLGGWELWVEKLVNWQPSGRVSIPTPGSFDNLSCSRSVFHPRWLVDSQPGNLRLAVTMTDCPENVFPDLDPDDDPWSVGALRIWVAEIDLN